RNNKNLDKAASILNYILANMANTNDDKADEDIEFMLYLTERVAKLYDVDVEELIKVQAIHIREAKLVIKMLGEFFVSVKK
ncbi:MAG: hypothetical protein QXN32_06985, partial [Candidatus Nitrosocaldus sp.]